MKADHASIAATIELLIEIWPQCFARLEYRRRPLKLRIDQDMHAVLDGAVTPKELATALRCYCLNVGYLRASWEGAWRIGLDGNRCGEVTAEEAANAKQRLAAMEAKRARRAAAASPPPSTSPSSSPKRLGLADLKAAARARREARIS